MKSILCTDCVYVITDDGGKRITECPVCHQSEHLKPDESGIVFVHQFQYHTDDYGFFTGIVIKATSHAQSEIEEFINKSQFAKENYRPGCNHSFDCCGCYFESWRTLNQLDESYGLWLLNIRVNQNV